MSISCAFIILRRKHPFALKILEYSKDHETYIYKKTQMEIPSFTFWILGFWDFQNPKNPKKIPKSQKNPKIPKIPKIKSIFPPVNDVASI